MLFALLFATYAVMVNNTAGGPGGDTLFSLDRAFLGTILLLLSSLTFGPASSASSEGRTSRVFFWLSVTFLLGAAFLGLEIDEFRGLIERALARIAAAFCLRSSCWWEPMGCMSSPGLSGSALW